MKKTILFSLLALACMACSKQKADEAVIRITDEDMFSQCFTICDADSDGIVTVAEAEAAKVLILDKGGRTQYYRGLFFPEPLSVFGSAFYW